MAEPTVTPTNNPVPSKAGVDLIYNAQTLDIVVNGDDLTTEDRFGRQFDTMKGYQAKVDAAIAEGEADLAAAVAATGYFPVAGSFEAGGTITERNQYLQLITTVGGNIAGAYTWGGPLPKVVGAGNTPASTGGVSPNTWAYRSDATIRSELALGTADVGGVTAQSIADLRSDLLSDTGAENVRYTPAGDDSSPTTLYDRLLVIDKAVGRTNKVVRLSGLGVNNGDNVNDVFTSIFADVADGTHVVIDRDVTFTGSTGFSITADDFTLEWEGDGHIHAPNISNSPSSFLFRFLGQQLTDLEWDPAHNIDEGEWYLPVLNTSNIQTDDLIGLFTDILFNGTGSAGFEIMNCQDWLRVRSVSASDIRATNAIWFSALAENITQLEHYRPMKRTKVINPIITGPANGIAEGVVNGQGARAFLCRGVIDFKGEGGKIVGYPGYAYQITRYDNAWIDGLLMDSGESARTTQGYYGVVHEGGRNGKATNCIGRNIRRVADTGGGGGLLAVDLYHENIRGELCNGSAAGTHHAKNYAFHNITSVSSLGSGMVIRSKDNIGDTVLSLNDNGQSISFFEASENANVGCGTTIIHNISCKGGYDTAGARGASIRIDANGDYDLQGDFQDHNTVGIIVQAHHLSGLKIRGTVKGRGCDHNISITNATTLENVDICGVAFDGSFLADITISGTTNPETPARLIKIEDNTSISECSLPITINTDSGWIAGETVNIENNISTNGSGTECLLIGNYGMWTAAPQHKNNFRTLNHRYSSFSRGNNVKTKVGSYVSIASLPSGFTFLDGDIVEINNPSAGAYPEYECVFAGTVGVLAGVTASVDSGSNIATLSGNTSGAVGPGTIITIAGSGVSAFRVSRITTDLTTATLSANAISTVSDAAVGYRNPTFKGRSLLEL